MGPLRQVNVVIHALGMLLCLPQILKPIEVIPYASLCAGKPGRTFDHEADLRIAEFRSVRLRRAASPRRHFGEMAFY